MADDREVELLREIRRKAEALDVTFVHLRKGLHLEHMAAQRAEVSIASYDDLMDAIGDLEGFELDG